MEEGLQSLLTPSQLEEIRDRFSGYIKSGHRDGPDGPITQNVFREMLSVLKIEVCIDYFLVLSLPFFTLLSS